MPQKIKILKMLKSDKKITENELCSSIKISQSELKKNITLLKNIGYSIDTSTGEFYSLTKIPDLLLPWEITDGLETSLIGQKTIYYHKTTGSTNTDAEILANNGAPEGTIVLAENQTKGKGRMGRTWFSSNRNGIYLSIILRPLINISETPMITIMSAVVLADVLSSIYKLKVQIKWPNDILVRGKKLSGILTTLNSDLKFNNYIVVGIGINVNTDSASIPDDIKQIATSILIEKGEKISRIKLLQNILESFESYYKLFINKKFKTIVEKWKNLSGIIGRQVNVELINKSLAGEVQGIDNNGFLILKTGEGETEKIIAGDIAKIN